MTDFASPKHRRFYDVPGGRLSAVHFGDVSKPVELVFLHGAGFNGYSYKTLLEPLGAHSVAIDFRGHGLSDGFKLEPDAIRNFHIFADDVVAYLDRYIDSPVVLAGHSMGAATSILIASEIPQKIRGYAGLDPVTLPMILHYGLKFRAGREFLKKNFAQAKRAGQRRAVFDSAQAMFERYHGRGTFKNVSDEALRNYITGGTRQHAGGLELTCAPLWEQAIYGAQNHNLYKAARDLPANSRIAYAGKLPASTPGTRRKMKRIVGTNKVSFHKEKSHFYPMSEQGFSRDILRSVLDAV